MKKFFVLLAIVLMTLVMLTATADATQRASPEIEAVLTSTNETEYIDQVIATFTQPMGGMSTNVTVVYYTIAAERTDDPSVPMVEMYTFYTKTQSANAQENTSTIIAVIAITVLEPRHLVVKRDHSDLKLTAPANTDKLTINHGGPVTKFTSSSLSEVYIHRIVRTDLGHLQV